MNGLLKGFKPNPDGSQDLTVTVFSDFTNTFNALQGKNVSVEIKKASNGRSRDANAFMWALCSDIGKALTPPVDKEDVYRRAIKAVGVYAQTPLLAWDVQKVKQRWESHGTGWFLEVVDDVPSLIGHKTVNLYYGSSTYTVDEMRLLIDWLMDQAEQMEIPIPLSKKEEAELLERWGKR